MSRFTSGTRRKCSWGVRVGSHQFSYLQPLDSFFIKKTKCMQHIYLRFEKKNTCNSEKYSIIKFLAPTFWQIARLILLYLFTLFIGFCTNIWIDHDYMVCMTLI